MMMPANGVHHYLRPGILRTYQTTYAKLRPAYDGLILSATSVCNRSEVKSFFQALTGDTPFLVDPRTFALATDPKQLRNQKSGKVRRSWEYLLSVFGFPEGSLPLDYRTVEASLSSLCERTVAFELSCVPPDSQMTLFGDTYNHIPYALVAPYFSICADHDPWVPVNEKLVKETCRLAGTLPVYAVLLLDRPLLSLSDQMESIAQVFAALPVHGYLVWIEGFRESTATVQEIIGFRRLIRILRGPSSRPVVNMYGGYLSALLFHHGLTGFSHRHDGGESRMLTPIRGGPQDVRFYLPLFHRYYILDAVEGYLARMNITSVDRYQSMICDCAICTEAMKDGIDGFMDQYGARVIKNGKVQGTQWSKELAAFHYMLVRHEELQVVQQNTLDTLVGMLQSVSSEYADPAGFERVALDTSHLLTWAEALKRPV